MTKSNNTDLEKAYLSFGCGTDEIKKKQRKKVSKNKKKNWRKHIDLTSVEDALEGQRLEERTTGNLSLKQNSEIFFIDTSTGNNETYLKRQELRNKRLFLDQLLVPNPEKVIEPTVTIGNKRIQHREAKAKRQIIRKKAQALKQEKSIISKQTNGDGLYDLWATNDRGVKDKIFNVKDVDKQRDFVHGKRQVKRPKHMYKKPNESKNHAAKDCPSVEVAHPGASYNPTLEDHQDLLRKANLVEEDKIHQEKKLIKSLHVPYKDLLEEGERNREMAEGLFDDNEDSDEQDSSTEVENVVKTVNPPVRASDRKTRRKRRLEQLEKDMKLEKEKAVSEKLRENEVFRTKTFLKEIKRKEQKIADKKELRDSRKKMPRLSKYKFEEAELELKLSSEVKGSLRELVPEGGIALDRYKSLQKRGIIEPRVKAGRNKKVLKTRMKMKYKEKRDFQAIQL